MSGLKILSRVGRGVSLKLAVGSRARLFELRRYNNRAYCGLCDLMKDVIPQGTKSDTCGFPGACMDTCVASPTKPKKKNFEKIPLNILETGVW